MPGSHKRHLCDLPRSTRKVRIERYDVDFGAPEEPAGNILSDRPQPGFDDDAQLDTNGGGRHQPDKRSLQVAREFIVPRLAEEALIGGYLLFPQKRLWSLRTALYSGAQKYCVLQGWRGGGHGDPGA
jgi:hypothetical protein